MLLFPDSFHSTSLDLDYWRIAYGSGPGVEFWNQCKTLWDLCFWQTGTISPLLPPLWSGIQLSLLSILVEKERVEKEIQFWDGSGFRSCQISQCYSCCWMSVCFWDAGNPLALTASPSCWLAIRTLWIWKAAEWREVWKKSFISLYSWGSVVNLWLSVGQTLYSSNALSSGGKKQPMLLWDVQQSSREGKELLLRHCFAGQKLECCWALAEKPFLNVSQPERVKSQRYYRGAVTDHFAMFVGLMTIQLRYEALAFPAVFYFLGGFWGGRWLSAVSLVTQLAGWGNFYSNVYSCLKRLVRLCRHKSLPIISI